MDGRILTEQDFFRKRNYNSYIALRNKYKGRFRSPEYKAKLEIIILRDDNAYNQDQIERRQRQLAGIEKRKETLRKKKEAQRTIFDRTYRGVQTSGGLFYNEEVDRVISPIIATNPSNDFNIRIYVDGQEVKNEVIHIDANDKYPSKITWDILFNLFQNQVVAGSDFTNSVFNTDLPVRVVIRLPDVVVAKKKKQAFRDGVDHCVISPLVKYYEEKLEHVDNKETIRKYKGRINTLRRYEAEYPSGIPEDKMEDLAKAICLNIRVLDILNGEAFSFNKKSSHSISFTNVRKNHLELGQLCINKTYDIVEQEEIDKLFKDHINNDIFATFKGNIVDGVIDVRAFCSVNGAWCVVNKDYEIYKRMNELNNINNYAINAVKEKELNDFILESRIINSAPCALNDNPNDIEGANYYDMTKAYTKSKDCKFYEGMLGKIHQFRKVSDLSILDKVVGIFQYRIISNDNWLLNKLGLKAGLKYTSPSPEIKLFLSLGVKIQLIAGCWGSTFNIEYTDEVMENHRYAIWAGKLGQDSPTENYQFITFDEEWVSHLKMEFGDNVFYFRDSGLCIVKRERTAYKTTHHILSFITSYTRITMILEMLKFEPDDLRKVVLDGIYTMGKCEHHSAVPFRLKNDEKKVHKGFRNGWYEPSHVSLGSLPVYDERFIKNCVLSGAGGTGKSHTILTDKGFRSVLYVSPTHQLGQDARRKYGCEYTTIHNLIGIKDGEKEEVKARCWADERGYDPAVIFIDELTMIKDTWIMKALDKYKHSLVFIAGDISKKQWFQTRSGCPGKFASIWLGSGLPFVEFTVDRRSKDEKMKALKLDLRNEMIKVFTDGNYRDTCMMEQYIRQNYNVIHIDDAIKMFTSEDTWIAGTHKTNKYLLEKGVVSGYLDKYKNRSKVLCDGEVRGAFTIHSYQGSTIDEGKIFIQIDDCFEYSMIYTAVSRGVNFDQIIFVSSK